MLITLASWGIIVGCSLIWGYAFVRLLFANAFQSSKYKIDVYLVAGIMCLTVYAQIVSIFTRVGRAAFCWMAIVTICLMALAIYKRQINCGLILSDFRSWGKKVELWKITLGVMVAVGVLVITAQDPEFVDTYLYHIQAVKWIEEYGVVLGLGNLHNRFAYNSSFLPLQALFSFSWTGKTLHSLNGCLACFFVLYSILTNRFFRREERRMSDAMKLVAVCYILLNRRTISSLSTDILPMLLVLYVLQKWSDCMADHEKENSYVLLCLFAVFAATVKLSTVTLMLLAVYPAYFLIREKKWKNILGYVIMGVLIMTPWLIRNIMISGYLVYPYSSIDLFDVDWKMPASLLDYDRQEIIVWGRGVEDVSRYADSFATWFPTWFSSQMLRNKLLIILGFGSTLILCGIILCQIVSLIRKKHSAEEQGWNCVLLLTVMVTGELFWLFSAPLVRYGMVYLMLPAAVVIYYFEERYGDKWNRLLVPLVSMVAVVILLGRSGEIQLIQPSDYWEIDSTANDFDGLTIYSASDGGTLSDHRNFPAVANIYVLQKIELRGDELSSGFRPKEQ